MPSTFVPAKFARLTADGGANGIVTLIDNEGWLPGAIVWIIDGNTAGKECVIVEQIGLTQVRLREKGSTPLYQNGVDLSAYTVAQLASLNQEAQVVSVDALFRPRVKA